MGEMDMELQVMRGGQERGSLVMDVADFEKGAG